MNTTTTNKVNEPAKRIVIKKEPSLIERVVRFACDEHKLSRTIHLRDLEPSIVDQLALHGLAQKVGDAAAMPVVNGKGATIEEKWAAMMEIADRLEAGMWNKEGRETGAKEYADTFAALVAWKGAEGDDARIAALRAWVEGDGKGKAGVGKEALFTLRDAKPELLAHYVRIKGRKATKEVDSAILDDLEAI